VGPGGIQAPALLGADVLRNRGALLKSVSDWYVQHLGGWGLDIERQGEMFALVLTSPDDPAVRVNLVDVGAGLSQVLPLVVQRKFGAAGVGNGGIEIVEQPELHLHPGAHGPLADLYIEAARQGGVRFLIETHSENFVLRIRRRIAEGTLSPNDVSLYWVDDGQRPGSRLVPVDIDAAGDVSHWPRGVFSEDFEEVKAIRAAQRGRSGV
jgi:predicted ATPase